MSSTMPTMMASPSNSTTSNYMLLSPNILTNSSTTKTMMPYSCATATAVAKATTSVSCWPPMKSREMKSSILVVNLVLYSLVMNE